MEKNNNKFSYLLNNEVLRGFKLLLPLYGLLLLSYLIKIIRSIFEMENRFQNTLSNGGTVESFLMNFNGQKIQLSHAFMSFDIIVFIMFAGIGITIIYTAFMWYREWFGNNKTIYMLMTLPVSRTKIIISKLISALIFFYTFICFEIIGLFITKFSFDHILSKEIMVKEPLFEMIKGSLINQIFKFGVLDNLLSFLFLVSVTLVVFSATFIERSYGKKGLLMGIVYGIMFIALYIIVPNVIYLFSFERMIYELSISIISIILNFFLSKYLLERKVHV